MSSTTIKRTSSSQTIANHAQVDSKLSRYAAKPSELLKRSRMSLRESGISALLSVCCEEENGSIVLTGTLPSYYLKQLAQQRVMALAESVRVRNETEVVYRSRSK